MQRFITWTFLVVLIGGFAATIWHALRTRAEAGREMPAYSVYSEDRNGLAYAARFLRNLGWEPVAVSRPIHQTRHRGLLIVVEPETGEQAETEVRGLLRWVEQGNTVLLCGRKNNAIHRELGIVMAGDVDAAGAESVQEAAVSDAGAYTDRIEQLTIEGKDTLRSKDGLPLWWLGEQPAAVVLRRGKGRVVVIADPSLLTARGLNRSDNYLVVDNLAALHPRGGRVYFDEYHHGLHSGGGFWGYLRYHDLEWLLGVVLVLTVVALWSVAVRLGPAVPSPFERRADAVDYASALARIYQRVGVRHLLAKGVIRDFLSALSRHLRLPPTALPVEILAVWRQKHAEENSRTLEGLLRGVSELRRRDVPERQLMGYTQAFDRFREELLTGKRVQPARK